MRSNPKRFWHYVNSKTKIKSSVPNINLPDGNVATTDFEKASAFNTYFSSVFTNEDLNNLPQMQSCSYRESLINVHISPDLVCSKLRTLLASKSSGPDGFHPKLLKETADQLCIPLCQIFNKSLKEGVLPQDWKVANVIPVFKKGDHHQPCNYRPISLTSTVCKVFESIIKDSIISHMMDNNLFSKEQHGFLPRRSCMIQLLIATEYWTEALNCGDSVDIIYFDFKKAFDSVPHERLLIKLKAYGIDGLLLHWIECFLTNRKQRVTVNESFSPWSDVISGIPQGSVLGPVLFSIYINDLPKEIVNPVLLFADDTKIFSKVCRNSSLEDIAQIQRDIDKLFMWSMKWQLFFNISKCKSLHLGGFNPKYTYQMNSQPIEQVSNEKDLGITIDSLMKFHIQTSLVTSKALRTVGIIKKSFVSLTKETFLCLYKAIIRPQLEYGNVIWGPFSVLDQAKVERVQRRATKLVPSIKHLSYQQRLEVLNLPSLKYRRLRGDMITVINDWNKLPYEVVTAPTLSQFKRQFDSFYRYIFYNT